MKRLAVIAVALAIAGSACGGTGPISVVRAAAAASPRAQVGSAGTIVLTSTTTSGTVITPAGAILHRPVGPEVKPAGWRVDCYRLVNARWTGECARVRMAGGTVIWVVENKPSSEPCCGAWRVRIYRYSEDAAGWFPELQAKDRRGAVYGAVGIRAIDLTADGKPELVAGFRFLGSGSLFGYDIVTFAHRSFPRVAAHPDLADHGGVVFNVGRLDEYRAEYPHSEPECCPAFFLHRAIRYDGSAFRARVVGKVPADSPMAQDWPANPFMGC